MVRALVAVGVVMGGAAVAPAATAAADDQAYLQPLRTHFVYLSDDQLLAEGQRVCQLLDRGGIAPTAVTMVRNEMGVAVGVADDIVSAAVQYLC
jgi:hypothetical protein